MVNSGKICVLNLQASSLPSFHQSDLKPYVVFLTPAPPQLARQQSAKHGLAFKVPCLPPERNEKTFNKLCMDSSGH